MSHGINKTKLEDLAGIGPKSAEKLRQMGIDSLADLLRHFPSDYEVMDRIRPIAEVTPGSVAAVAAVIEGKASVNGYGKNSVISFRIGDGSGRLRISYFHMPYIREQIRAGEEKVFRGLIKDGGRFGLSMIQPRMYERKQYEALQGQIRSRYLLPGGISEARYRQALQEALAGADFPEMVPTRLLPPGAMEAKAAYHHIHFPSDRASLEAARARLVFEEFFLFILRLRQLKQSGAGQVNHCPIRPGAMAEKARGSFPFALTGAQERAYAEILRDMAGSERMNRLLQGDVGSGKTAVALLSLLAAADSGFQGALMAPTEVLAEQHYRTISGLLAQWELPIQIACLTGSLKESEKRRIRAGLEDGSIQLAIGTHALIQESVSFRNLGLVITDEQHRFGVGQRSHLAHKGEMPHVLVMSATPIPRTLAIILYGDLSVSLLDELPGGRRPIQSAVVGPGARAKAFALMEKEIRAGHRAFIVCPFIEESEAVDGENVIDYTEKIRNVFPADIAIGSLHGAMKSEEKNRIMKDFAEGRIQLLVSTTVIEVGVDVPQATVMMVENAERFGLAQLHQLRGRVGRGQVDSYAIFVDGSGKKKKNERLAILARSQDGFEIAEEDLKHRGPGDMFGIRQSGEMRFKLGDIYTDQALLHQAAAAADAFMQMDPMLADPAHGALKSALEQLALDKESL